MGQYFAVINLDNSFPVRTRMCGKFGECFWEIDAEVDRGLMKALWQTEKNHKVVTIEPLSELRRPEKPLYIWDKRMALPEESLANATLPAELVRMILEEIEDFAEMICFVLTCQRYFEIGRPILEARLEELLTCSWAGNRLICIGDYAVANDFPEGMLTEDEQELIDEEFDDCDAGDVDTLIYEQLRFVQNLQPDWDLNQKRTIFNPKGMKLLYHFMFLREKNPSPNSGRPRVGSGDGRRDVQVIERLTKVTPRAFPDRTQLPETYGSYVLRNLTTKEYIRGDAVREAWNTPNMPYLRALRFMHLLILRITWSSEMSLSVAYEGPIQVHRGVWAGHRFDFSDIKTVQDGEGAIGDWKDVSKVAIDELVAIFEREADDLNEQWSYRN
ncbi:hypothetical protein FPV67DRAFT_1674905 [Lyophyllum atratum]|nr:hypothetical protein FPV67DRAFT_1674905 [Lyophyllum atratum]